MLDKLFNQKKWYFKQLAQSVQNEIWTQEFKLFASAQVREGIRQDRDRQVDASHKIDAALKANPKDENLQKEAAEVVGNIKRFEAQMKMMDEQMQGKKAEGDDPGIQGINDNLAMLASRLELYTDYLKTL